MPYDTGEQTEDPPIEKMSCVTINLFSSIRYAAGTSTIEIMFPSGQTVYELLGFVADKYGKELKDEIFMPDGNKLRDDLTIIVNGMIARQSAALDKKIEDSTIVTLLPVFPGGG